MNYYIAFVLNGTLQKKFFFGILNVLGGTSTYFYTTVSPNMELY